MVLEGPLIHHLEVSKQGFVLAVLPFGKIQTRFRIVADLPFKTIWGINTLHSYFTIQNHNRRMVSNGASTCMKKVPKVGGLKGKNNENIHVFIFVCMHSNMKNVPNP